MKKTNKLLKRAMSFLLILIMTFTTIPMTAFADSADLITVYVTISAEGQLQFSKDSETGMVRVPITVSKGATAFDALVAAHNKYYEGDYVASEDKVFSRFWGNNTMDIGYFVNGKMVLNRQNPVFEGDDIEGTIYNDYLTDIYARFDKQNVTVDKNSELSLTLKYNDIINGPNGMMNKETVNKPLAQAKILIGDLSTANIPANESAEWITDKDGKITISFENPGVYYVSAQKEGVNIIPPICKVIVTDPVSNEDKEEYVREDKEKLTFSNFGGENTSIDDIDKNLNLPANGKSGNTTITWTSNDQSTISNDGTVTQTIGEKKTVKLTANIAYGSVSDTKSFNITVKAAKDPKIVKDEAQMKEIKDKIASVYAAKNSEWWGSSATWWQAVGMSAYKNTSSDTIKVVSPDAKQAFINKTVSDITTLDKKASVNANKFANAINGMSAFGCDPTALWTVNKTKIDAVSQLKNIKLEDAKQGWYSTIAPYVLLSLNQGNYNTDDLKIIYINYLIDQLKNADWSWGVDTPAMVLQGLAPYYNREDVKPEIDKIILALSEKQDINGSYGNPYSDASIIITLAQLGINPDTDSRFIKNGKSVVDGLLSYKLDSNDGFYVTEGKYDEYATVQGFLALIAASEVMENGQPYNVYDFSKIAKTDAYANGTGGKEETPKDPVSDKEINVSFILKSDAGTWIPKTTTTVKSDATVYHAFTKVLNEKGFNYIISNKNYVSSITNPSGKCLSEFDKGKNSGWLYSVNGKVPANALTKCNLYDGDNIVWYYTTDWTKDPDAVEAAGGKSAIKALEETEKDKATGKTEVQATTDKDGKALAEVKTKDISDAIEAVVKASEKSGSTAKKEVKIVVKADDKAKEVETKLPKDSMVELNKKVDVVTVQTPLADIVFDKQNLELMSKNINGDAKLSVRKIDIAKEGNISEESKSKIKEKVGNRPIFDFNLTVGDKKISNFANNVQVSIPYTAAESENVNGIVVYYINDSGNLQTVKDCKYDSKTKILTFSTNHFSNYAVGYNNISFDDISKHWAKDQIVYLAARDVVKGVNNAGFAPNDKVTRAEFVQILANLSGADLSKYDDSKFKDAKKGVWFANSAAWAAETGLVTGNSNNDGTVSFNPNESITRQDMAVILSRYMTKIEQKKLSEVNKEVKFSDKDQIGSYAESAVAELQKAGIISGKTAYNFAPKENATRAECSKMISVLMQNYL
ncbi:S-layer homology domain-containing protein [Aminipila terrae]|uniref:DUF4430 domain-containing protein n=1 Tax=Aminipila terrae TaxID=2697030 RepID=A0A6P1MIF7_9FIRM|nr:S-layer homology domain-containing protein [Aminipila terrae]QHI71386.1 DUF4430 domain-containing protein [Aminipila terrae]